METAIRFDTDKPELHHIHPDIFQKMINQTPSIVSKDEWHVVYYWSMAMNNWFYHQKHSLSPIFEEGAINFAFISLMSDVLKRGASKYADLNYVKGMAFKRVLNSFRRHVMKMRYGELIDPEFGIDHRGHILCNMLFAYTYDTLGIGEDDRVLLS